MRSRIFYLSLILVVYISITFEKIFAQKFEVLEDGTVDNPDPPGLLFSRLLLYILIFSVLIISPIVCYWLL